MTDHFSENQNTGEEGQNQDFFSRLVGDDKKFKDQEALARGKWESDEFISDLQRQNQELREDLEKASKLDELLQEVRSQRKATDTSEGGNEGRDDGEGSNNTSSGLTEEQLTALIESTLSQREVENRANKNLQEVNDYLSEQFGSKAGEFLKSKVSEVGLSVDRMKELAAENPKAFYRLVGLDGQKTNQSIEVGGNRQNSEGRPTPNATQKRDFAYYQQLRKENKGRYYSPEIQMQLFKDRKEMGDDAFYGRN